jgi:hypothetical protein
MGLRQCEKCDEMVDEAKAFCPGCGHAFVEEEKRQKASEFERSENTVQLGQTMYNQMLSDMGLNIAGPPGSEKKGATIPPISGKSVVTVAPAVKPAEAKPEPGPVRTDAQTRRPGRAKWIVLAVIGFVLLFPPALGSTVILVLQIWERYR